MATIACGIISLICMIGLAAGSYATDQFILCIIYNVFTRKTEENSKPVIKPDNKPDIEPEVNLKLNTKTLPEDRNFISD